MPSEGAWNMHDPGMEVKTDAARQGDGRALRREPTLYGNQFIDFRKKHEG